jgi:NAD(P)-dependent dehydrogenase (short-subunit alcohol dehydrogenase family)
MAHKVAVVTGSTSNIGEATARMFAAEGAQVVVTGRQTGRGETIAESIRGSGGDAHFVAADLRDEGETGRLFHAALERYGRVTTLVNNAAPTEHLGRLDKQLGDLSTQEWETMLLSGLTGAVFWTTKYALPHLRACESSSIINISATNTIVGLRGADGYTATKGAMNALTRSIAVEYGADGVRCNALLVGYVPGAQRMKTNPAFAEAFRAVQLTRIGEPEDIAYACVYLGSDESAFMTGSLITIDGGFTISNAPKLSRS